MPVQTTSLNTFATVGITSSKVVSGNGARSGLTLSNSSSGNIWISLGKAAVIGSGIMMTPGATRDFAQFANISPIWLGDIYAISDLANSNLGICEVYA